MVRDYQRVAEQLERVINVFNEAYENKQRITITKACNIAGVHVAWLYRILNNIDDYRISDEQLERYEEVRDRVFSEVIQGIDDIAHNQGDYSGSGDSEYSTKEDDNTSPNNKPKDSSNQIARDALRMKHEQWKLKNLLPKHFNEGSSNTIALTNSDNRQYNVIVQGMSLDQLRSLASNKIIDMGNDDE